MRAERFSVIVLSVLLWHSNAAAQSPYTGLGRMESDAISEAVQERMEKLRKEGVIKPPPVLHADKNGIFLHPVLGPMRIVPCRRFQTPDIVFPKSGPACFQPLNTSAWDAYKRKVAAIRAAQATAEAARAARPVAGPDKDRSSNSRGIPDAR